jgi:hypothetical protein
MDNLVRKALLGDKKSQEECTEKGNVLPCPFCGKELREHKTRKWTVTKDESINRTIVEHKAKTGCHLDNWAMDKELDLESWNTRPAPPIGRCGECEHYNTKLHYCDILSQESDYRELHYVLMSPDDFCSYFEPKEEE